MTILTARAHLDTETIRPRRNGSRPDDGELIRRALAGRPEAREEVVQRLTFIPRVLRAMNRRSAAPLSETELDDAGQEAVLAVWRKLATFDGSVKLETWVYRFAQIELLRSRRKRGRTVSSDDAEETPAPAESSCPWDLEALYASLERLEEPERRVVELKHFSGLTFEQIGPRLSIPVNTAKSRYYRALRQLRRDLERGQRKLGGHGEAQP